MLQIRALILLVAAGLIFTMLGCESGQNTPSAGDSFSEDDGTVDAAIAVSEVLRARGEFRPEFVSLLVDLRINTSNNTAATKLDIELARIHSHMSNAEELSSSARQARLGANQSNDFLLQSHAQYVSVLASLRSDSVDARKYAEMTLASAEKSDHPAALSQAYWALGLVSENNGQIEDALSFYMQSIESISSPDSSTEAVVESYFHAGHMQDQLGNKEQALQLYQLADQTARVVAVPRLFAFASYHRGRILQDHYSQPNQALREFSETVEILEAQSSQKYFLYPITQQRLGDIYQLLGEMETALAHYSIAVESAREHGHERMVARAISIVDGSQ